MHTCKMATYDYILLKNHYTTVRKDKMFCFFFLKKTKHETLVIVYEIHICVSH